MHIIAAYFGLPYGAVYSNLIASAICFTLGIAWSHRRMKRHIDKRLQEHHDNLKELHK